MLRILLILMLFGSTALAKAPDRAANTPKIPTPAGPPLLKRPGSGSTAATSFRSAVTGTTLPQWPVALRRLDELRRACTAASCERWDKIELSLQGAAAWMAGFGKEKIRFDAAVALSQIRQTVDSEPLRAAFELARWRADMDSDHPQRRFWWAEMQSRAKDTSLWPVPNEVGKRTSTNNVLHEALYCKEHGWRAETMTYVCGNMRDEGAYETTHALWALSIAYQNGCISDAAFTPCARSMQEELAKAQPSELQPQKTLDIDLYAERVLQSLMTGTTNPATDQWIETLLRLQRPDGSWGLPSEGEDPYFSYHATMMSTWAISEWYRRLVAYPQLRPK